MSEESGKVIMVVDDTEDILWTVKQILKSENYGVIEAGGGLECLRKLYDEKKKPDLILLDIMMEPMDGWVTLKTIKNDVKLKDIPVSMLTALPPDEDVVGIKTISLIENYIVKPFTKKELLEKVGDVFVQKDLTEQEVKILIDKSIPKVAEEYEHLVTEMTRRARIVESMEKSKTISLSSGKSADEVIRAQKEMIQVMKKRVDLIKEKYGV